ncbi:hypothetical protein AB0P30_11565 [Micrococcus luteus]|uniref:hypothetical protein n=1 Tax=Micrococcus luteus TaxID=1270 RepID=UPI0034454FE6
MLLMLADWERDLLREHTREGVARARAAGRRPGPKSKLDQEKTATVRAGGGRGALIRGCAAHDLQGARGGIVSQNEQPNSDPAWASARDQEDTQVQQPDSVPPATSRLHTLEALRAARSDGEDEDEPNFTFSELQEALGDESHPRHDEAVEANRVMAERLHPRLLALNESVLRQVMPSMDLMRGLRLSSSILPDTSALSAASAAATAAAVPRIDIPKVNLPKAPTVPSYSIPEPPEIAYEGIEEAARLRADREAQQDEQAALSLEVQQSMAA